MFPVNSKMLNKRQHGHVTPAALHCCFCARRQEGRVLLNNSFKFRGLFRCLLVCLLRDRHQFCHERCGCTAKSAVHRTVAYFMDSKQAGAKAVCSLRTRVSGWFLMFVAADLCPTDRTTAASGKHSDELRELPHT